MSKKDELIAERKKLFDKHRKFCNEIAKKVMNGRKKIVKVDLMVITRLMKNIEK